VRVITGSARGRRLKEPNFDGVRPTSDKVKEAMFNMIQFDVPGSRVLDLFAGTGQLGIEALSRGADSAVFIDSSRQSAALVRENVKISGFEDKSRVICGDSLAHLSSGVKYDIIFMDPPYATDLIEQALVLTDKFDILDKNGIILCESDRLIDYERLNTRFLLAAERKYGRIRVSVLKHKSAGDSEENI